MDTASSSWRLAVEDRRVLRELAQELTDKAHSTANLEKKRLWYALDECRAERPMVLVESWVSFMSTEASHTQCQEEWAQDVERMLRYELYQDEVIQDDHVIEPYIRMNWKVAVSDYGVTSKQVYADRVSGNVSSRHWEPPVQDMQRDLAKLRPRTYSVNREETLAWQGFLADVFEGIVPVRIRGGFWWTTGLTQTAIDLVGLENFMMYILAEPDALHWLMRFLRDDMMAYARWLEREELLSLNNENDYIGSGSMGYTNALPQADYRAGEPVRLRDQWVLCESQETVSVGPQYFEEFAFQYQVPIVELFGRCYYGCCEPVHDRWHILKKLPNLKRLSISPWCDQAFMAEALGNQYVFSRKPNPTLVSVPEFNEDLIRQDVRETLTVAKGCPLEIIMKDVHTVCDEPERLARWVAIVKEEIAAKE